MTQAKIEFSFGSLTFSGEGDSGWLEKQLDKVIAAAPKLSELRAPANATNPTDVDQSTKSTSNATGAFSVPLSRHIKDKGGDSNQNKRFLATADWLRQRGYNDLTTAKVSKALSENHQKKLGNPADCLNKLVSRGFCEKRGKEFFITPDGLNELGYSE